MRHLLAALAEKERALIKAALSAKKKKGNKLGNPRAAETIGKAHAARRAAADRFAVDLQLIVRGRRPHQLAQDRGCHGCSWSAYGSGRPMVRVLGSQSAEAAVEVARCRPGPFDVFNRRPTQ
jgi:hypothetical protein